MDDPTRLFTTIVLLASAAYVVVTNLQFRRLWPATVARCRQRVTATMDREFARQLDLDAVFAGVERNRNLLCAAATVAGAFSGALAGLLLNAALMVLGSPPRVDHSLGDVLVGAAFGALAFAILASEA